MSDLPPQVIIGLLVLVVVVIRRLRPTVRCGSCSEGSVISWVRHPW